MKRFETTILELPETVADQFELLNAMGRIGWGLASITEVQGVDTAYLVREVQDDAIFLPKP